MRNLIALLSLIAMGPAVAMDDSEVLKKLSPAWVSVEEKTVNLVGPDYQKLIVDAAFANVAVSACPGLSLNGPEIDKRFNQLVSEKGGQTPEEIKTFLVRASTLYGTYVGLLVAESHLDTAAFCKYVDNAKASKKNPNPFWIVK